MVPSVKVRESRKQTFGSSFGLIVLVLVTGLLSACGDNTAAPSTAPVSVTTAATGAANSTGVKPTTAAAAGAATTAAGASGAASSSSNVTAIDYKSLSATISGSGSSFINPVMQEWIKTFSTQAPGVKLNYNSVGSGQGRQDFFGGKTDFAGTDAYPTDKELNDYGKKVVVFPSTLGAVVLAYNLSGITELNLSPETLGKIFTGGITKWNDAAIKADNPNANFPDKTINLAVRQDNSGTTSIFSSYLALISPEFSALKIAGGQPDWSKAGINPVTAPQNDGVAGLVQKNDGTIGYIEVSYSLANKISYAKIKNKAGKFVDASLENISAAAASIKVDPQTLKVDLLNQPGDNSYPISATSYFVINQEQQDAPKAQSLLAFMVWVLQDGQKQAPSKFYAPLPVSLTTVIKDRLKSVLLNGKPILS